MKFAVDTTVVGLIVGKEVELIYWDEEKLLSWLCWVNNLLLYTKKTTERLIDFGLNKIIGGAFVERVPVFRLALTWNAASGFW